MATVEDEVIEAGYGVFIKPLYDGAVYAIMHPHGEGECSFIVNRVLIDAAEELLCPNCDLKGTFVRSRNEWVPSKI